MGGAERGCLAPTITVVCLLRHRKGLARLDVGPFAILYSLILVWISKEALSGSWPRPAMYVLAAAAAAHILVLLFSVWNVGVKAAMAYARVSSLEDAEVVKVVPEKFCGSPEIVNLDFRLLADVPFASGSSNSKGAAASKAQPTVEVSFEFRRQRFIYDADTDVFDEMRYPDKEPFAFYQSAGGYGTADKVAAGEQHWGSNKFDVPAPPFTELLKEQMLAPFFVFQVFCVLLWTIDEYWYYSLFTLGMLVTFECTVVFQRIRNLNELRSLQTPKQKMQVYRGGKWREVPGDALLPGDLVSVVRPSGEAAVDDPVLPADCLLLAGSCIVEEAVLTGESTPQWKVPVGDLPPSQPLNVGVHKAHVLFGGTHVLQHTGDKGARVRTPDGGCLAFVLRTGFETSQGRLMRTILFSTERITANSLETGVFILFLLVFAVSAAAYVLHFGLADPKRDRFKLALNCIMIITSVIPPELPMELTIAVNTSLVALAKHKVFCTEPFRIPFAGRVEVCCFDKTGTLTTDHLLLEGVAGVPGSEGRELMAGALPPQVSQVLASCHALVQVDSELVGDPLEKAAISASGWTYANDLALSPDRKSRLAILSRHHFNSDIKRMAALVRLEDDAANEPQHLAVVKGAPEVLKPLLKQAPRDYDATHRGFAAQGARVIALALKHLPASLGPAELRALPREEVESGLEFVGFAVFQCPLKPESAPTLEALAASSHSLVMITGDAPLTACHAAARVSIVTRPVLIMQSSAGGFEWASPDDATRLHWSPSWPHMLGLAAEYDLCVTGDALSHAHGEGMAERLIPLCQVFARVSPEQKEQVIKTLRAAGCTTLMCGDGTNDVGGLKAAHVGVALLSAIEHVKGKGKGKGDKRKGSSAGSAPKEAAAGRQSGRTSPASGGPAAEAGAVVEAGRSGRKAKPDKKAAAGTAMLEDLKKRGQPVPPGMEKMAAWLDKMEQDSGEPPLLKPGDASMASPFTAKAASVAPITDIIKQGRCTLVTTVQMFKVLGLLCLSTAYSLSVMYLQGVKLSDSQATLGGVLTAGMFFFVSSAKPLERLSTARPHPSIFCVYFFASLLGQFAAHLAFIALMYRAAVAAMPADQAQDSESEFQPNLVNSVCYLTSQTVQLITFAVNYVGPPFNTPLAENKGMRVSLTYSTAFLAILVAQVHAPLNESFSLVPIPAMLRLQFVGLALAVMFGTLLWEHALRTAFPAPRPPAKGYMRHMAEVQGLAKAGPAGSEGKKRQ